MCSDTEHSEYEAVRPPRRKRLRASAATHTARGTAPQQQVRPFRGASSREARRPTRRPRRQSTLERDTEADRTPATTFDEWPLKNAVLQRVTIDGSPPTFVIQFSWGGPYAEHGAGHRGTESQDAISSTERRRPTRQKSNGVTKDKGKPTSTSNRVLPSRVVSTTEETQVDKYFKVDKILEYRQGEEGLEYLVKWAGYGKKHNSWEPTTYFEQCLEILEQLC